MNISTPGTNFRLYVTDIAKIQILHDEVDNVIGKEVTFDC